MLICEPLQNQWLAPFTNIIIAPTELQFQLQLLCIIQPERLQHSSRLTCGQKEVGFKPMPSSPDVRQQFFMHAATVSKVLGSGILACHLVCKLPSGLNSLFLVSGSAQNCIDMSPRLEKTLLFFVIFYHVAFQINSFLYLFLLFSN